MARIRDMREVIEHGQTVPVHVDHGFRLLSAYADVDLTSYARGLDELLALWFGNGHHRVAIARELGWTHMICSPEKLDTGTEYEPYR